MLEDIIFELKAEIKRAEFTDDPYVDCVSVQTLREAVVLLKTQVPHVLTLEEIPLFDGAIYMDEYPIPVCLKMLYCYEVGRGTYGHGYTFVDSDGDKIFFPAKEFGKKWRCWTQRPTDEQREATPWEVNTYD